MVSYYNNANMYRHHQPAANAPANAPGHGMHTWYSPSNYHHQAAASGIQMTAPEQQFSYDPQMQMWHPHPHMPTPHSVFNGDFPEFMHAGAMVNNENHNQLVASPTITVSGSELSSPGVEHVPAPSPQEEHHHHVRARSSQGSRPGHSKSPYDWMRTAAFQLQATPELLALIELHQLPPLPKPVAIESSEEGKTRTKDKYRVVYTDHQRVELEKEFYYSRYITIRRKAELASTLGLSERQVKIWFQNRRAKERKQVKKREEFTQKDNPLTIGHMPQTQSSQLIHSNQTPIGQNLMTSQIM